MSWFWPNHKEFKLVDTAVHTNKPWNLQEHKKHHKILKFYYAIECFYSRIGWSFLVVIRRLSLLVAKSYCHETKLTSYPEESSVLLEKLQLS